MLNIFRSFVSAASRQSHRRGQPKRKSIQLNLEHLQDRIVPAVDPVFLSGSQLVINGTESSDHVEVSGASGSLLVSYNGADYTFTGKVKKIVFSGNGGDDFFSNSTDIRVIARGGEGSDTIFGGGGKDRLYGELGDDSLHGGRGKDDLRGGSGSDDLYGDEDNDKIYGELGDDNLHGGTGRDSLRGGDDDDSLDGDLGRDSLDGGRGSDDAVNLSDDSSRNCESGRQHDSNELVAGLSHSGGAFGRGKFESETEHGLPRNDFELELAKAPANQTLDIVLDGLTVAQVTTSSRGSAELHMRGVSFLAVNGSNLVVKDSLGNTVAQGTFAIETEDDGSESLLLANLTSATAAFGSGKVEVETEGGSTKTEFEVRLKSGPALKTLTVFVNATPVGDIVTGDSGNGELELLNPGFEVLAGATVEVKDSLGNVIVTGVFQTA